MIPAPLMPVILGLVLSCLISLLAFGVSPLRSAGLVDGFFGVAPLARRIVSNCARPAEGQKR